LKFAAVDRFGCKYKLDEDPRIPRESRSKLMPAMAAGVPDWEVRDNVR